MLTFSLKKRLKNDTMYAVCCIRSKSDTIIFLMQCILKTAVWFL